MGREISEERARKKNQGERRSLRLLKGAARGKELMMMMRGACVRRTPCSRAASSTGCFESLSVCVLPRARTKPGKSNGNGSELFYRSRSGRAQRPRAQPPRNNVDIDREAKLRSEVEAPFRVFRIAAYAALSASAGLGAFIAAVRCLGGIARGDITLTFQGFIASEDITGLGIDLAALSVLLFLFRKESAARDRQIKRLQNETTL